MATVIQGESYSLYEYCIERIEEEEEEELETELMAVESLASRKRREEDHKIIHLARQNFQRLHGFGWIQHLENFPQHSKNQP